MNFLQKLSCFHRHEPREIAHPYRDTLPPPRAVLIPMKTPSRFPTNVSRDAEAFALRTRVASQAPQIPPDLFTNPTVRVLWPSPELERDGPPWTGVGDKDLPKSPRSWLTTASDESAGSAVLGAEKESKRTLGGDLRVLPSVKGSMQYKHGKSGYHAR
ncbi:hypothetical protein DOTSEDRAFT_22047 [Dothistroma septosporum NZE10]|uniref:Uncharacterized protein n=1 Tax=Dothistroma septosporum (strain NZE10 / CBS 128990) TaxID=675120 RepID=N1PU91_DOTSN|nr:hypothetical protein DOTSEDRAFT_22047 [Dothistroma septosporum NZE10]